MYVDFLGRKFKIISRFFKMWRICFYGISFFWNECRVDLRGRRFGNLCVFKFRILSLGLEFFGFRKGR